MKTAAIASAAALAAMFFHGAQALAQDVETPATGRFVHAPKASVTTPSSSIAKSAEAGKAAHTNTKFIGPKGLAPSNAAGPRSGAAPAGSPPYADYGFETPASLACLYGLVAASAGCNPNVASAVPTAKGAKAIALVDAYDYPTALSDLQTFSVQFGLPLPNLIVKYATAAGSCNGPKPANDSGWEGEEALDVQMAHAMAPQATLYLVEAQDNSNANLAGAVACANSLLQASGGGEVSMSWGGSEVSNYENYFSANNVVYFASSGDAPGPSWPSTSPNVVSVGGTSIARDPQTYKFLHYASWSEAGGGASEIFPRPTYQSGAGITGTARLTPDISAVANPDTGVWVYDSNPYYGTGWYVYGGTSVAAPLVAAITNAHNNFRANTATELTAIYKAKKASAKAFATATIGYCGPYAAYQPTTKWNICLGVGTIKGTGTANVLPVVDAQE
ncbi:S53 family peptidase [Methylocella silvestris]|nr:hypothetical protein [Methylocella silvestris]